MAREFYVNGEASCAIDSGLGLNELGVTVDGVGITINEYTSDIMVDTRGNRVPGDVQYMLNDAIIKVELVYFDFDVVRQLLTGLPRNPPIFGEWGNAGVLLLAQGYAIRLLVRSTPANTGITGQASCWNFPTAFLVDAQETKIGTVRSTWTLTFRALPAYVPSTTTGQMLWNETCT